MGKFENSLEAILRGSSDQYVAFDDLRHVLSRLGFHERIKGDYFIFSRDGVMEIVNLQPIGNKAKAYQVKQVRNLMSSTSLPEIEYEQSL